ncbi:zinc finger protein ubi-d4 B isoform X2 [Cimex lectularius]|uniref:Uncharacterized protein n=1 Tax=Cimex lectularius TaxID=79782 RepID=A0A8I6THB3_CIMLE|nr:zinc finger protein ubi-d4 B isoform X2 [Cimex lectularius]
MASCDIQIVNSSVLNRIESFMADASYREAIENSANYNTRLCVERRLRMPFLDSQTGVAQNHSNLFMTARERIPGLQYGQVYTYPSKRWRKKRRQYLMQPQVGLRRCEVPSDSSDLHTISTVENPAAAMSEDSKDSAGVKDESAKSSDAWYYDDFELHSMEGFDDQDPDSDYDYEETYSKRRKKGRGGKTPGRGGATPTDSPHPKKGGKGTGQGRGRKKGINYAEIGDSEKPFSCDLCGARYKTRPGLTYHYTHSHKEGTSATPSTRNSSSGGVSGGTSQTGQSTPTAGLAPPPNVITPSQPSLIEDEQADSLAPPSPLLPQQQQPVQQQGWTNFAQDNYLTFLNAPGPPAKRGRPSAASQQQQAQAQIASSEEPIQNPVQSSGQSSQNQASTPHPAKDKPPDSMPECSVVLQQVLIMEQNEKPRATPSPYCDFCLGDAVSNKKSGQPEELVSCSDCGRSGHPSCLLFTNNMIVSVRKYRWQCIECKCCSICGTSDNDDQLLFCDDCDRGYHMYCLVPPLHTPPEGSWSCRSCIRDFH